MTYYKIIVDETVIGVGTTFLRWYSRSRAYYICGHEQGEAVQDAVTGKMYHPDWLRMPGGYAIPSAEVILITVEEYDELYEQLGDGEEIPVSEPEPYAPPEPEPSSEPEHRMTVQEMRDKIQELDETLNVILGVTE